MLGKFPRELTWLGNQLARHPDSPFIIAFHFPLEGAYSDWWPEKTKQRFYQIIKDYRILAILVGHRHASDVSLWKGIRVIISGKKFALIKYDPEHEEIVDVSFARKSS